MSDVQMEIKNDTAGKTVLLMETLVRADGVLSVRDAALRSGIPRSTAHRLLKALERAGWVVQDGETGSFRVGVRFFLLSRRSSFFSELVRCARPAMRALMERTGKTSILSVIEEGRGLCIHTEQPAMAVKFVAHEGMDVPLNAGATGLVLLAWCSDSLRRRVLETRFPRGLSGDELRDRIDRIRRQGYSHSREEWMEHAEDLSVPVFDRNGLFAAQLGIAGLAGAFGDWKKELLPALREASAEISSAL
ncbi:MAG: IclR family transcriptional regulator [Pyramidobacter sp.]|jgi:IclR family KDG regulon transcriptional repressor